MRNKKTAAKFIALVFATIIIFTNILTADAKVTDGYFYVHLVDVGGDTIIIQSPNNEFMMIDTGYYTANKTVHDYLKKIGVDKLKYLILTHEHSDHVDSAPTIIKEYPVETLMMPKRMHTMDTEFMIKLRARAKENNIDVIAPVVGQEFTFDGAKFVILGPNKDEYDDLNDYSIVLKMTYGNNTFMFTGDMTEVSEREVISYAEKNGIDLKSDVLKVAHHGCPGSTKEPWLSRVRPRYAVIGCGDFEGHADAETIKNLESINAEVYRTDLFGNIVIKSDGNNIEILDNPSAWSKAAVDAAMTSGLVPPSMRSRYAQAITRAEFCEIVVNLYEKVTGNVIAGRETFDDVKDINIEKAAAIGVVTGVGDNLFAPGDTLTREQAAVILSRLANAAGKPLPKKTAAFADNEKIESWAFESVGQIEAIGVVNGVGDNIFAPKDLYTREQSIASIYRMWNYLK